MNKQQSSRTGVIDRSALNTDFPIMAGLTGLSSFGFLNLLKWCTGCFRQGDTQHLKSLQGVAILIFFLFIFGFFPNHKTQEEKF